MIYRYQIVMKLRICFLFIHFNADQEKKFDLYSTESKNTIFINYTLGFLF